MIENLSGLDDSNRHKSEFVVVLCLCSTANSICETQLLRTFSFFEIHLLLSSKIIFSPFFLDFNQFQIEYYAVKIRTHLGRIDSNSFAHFYPAFHLNDRFMGRREPACVPIDNHYASTKNKKNIIRMIFQHENDCKGPFDLHWYRQLRTYTNTHIIERSSVWYV